MPNYKEGLVAFAPTYPIGDTARRNYVGTSGGKIYIFTSTQPYTSVQANDIMLQIQPDMSVIQLDGGGSAQVYSHYGEIDSSVPVFDRPVADVLAVYRAPSDIGTRAQAGAASR